MRRLQIEELPPRCFLLVHPSTATSKPLRCDRGQALIVHYYPSRMQNPTRLGIQLENEANTGAWNTADTTRPENVLQFVSTPPFVLSSIVIGLAVLRTRLTLSRLLSAASFYPSTRTASEGETWLGDGFLSWTFPSVGGGWTRNMVRVATPLFLRSLAFMASCRVQRLRP